MFDFKAGLTYNITNSISFDLYGAYGESEVQQRRRNYVLRSSLQQALILDPSDPTKCADTSGGCVPLNLFGPLGSITPAMAQFIGGTESTINRGGSLAQVHAVVSGDFGWTTPWATKPIAFAIGAEHRDYTGHTRPDFLAAIPGELGGAGGAILPIEGGYTAEDVFGELIVPIAADRPFFQELQLEAGYRRSHYVIDAAGKPKFSADFVQDRRQLGAGRCHQVPRQLPTGGSRAEHRRIVRSGRDRPDRAHARSLRGPGSTLDANLLRFVSRRAHRRAHC